MRRTYKCLTHEQIEKQTYLTYPPDVVAISQYQHITKPAGQYSLVLHRFKGKEENLPPAENQSTYPSIRKEVGEHVDAGKVPRTATFEVTINNASEVPKIFHTYEFNRQKNKKTDDPLKQLIEKYYEDAKSGQKVIQTFQPNKLSYDVVLYKERIVKNIANVCCGNIAIFKSPLCFDFTFDLGKSPTYFALVLTYQNTSLISKQTTKSPTMFGPILLCLSKDEDRAHVLCQSVLQSCPGLKNSLKVVGADGEKSISNAVFSSFPASILLLCDKHMEENIERHLSGFTEAKKKK